MARFARPRGRTAQHSAQEPSKALCQRTPRKAKQGTTRKTEKNMGNQSHRALRVASLQERNATQQGTAEQQSTHSKTFPKTLPKPSQNHPKTNQKPSQNHSKTIPRGFPGHFPCLSSKLGPYRPLSDSPRAPKITKIGAEIAKKLNKIVLSHDVIFNVVFLSIFCVFCFILASQNQPKIDDFAMPC